MLFLRKWKVYVLPRFIAVDARVFWIELDRFIVVFQGTNEHSREATL